MFFCFSLAERLVGIYEDVDENSTEPSVFSEEGGEATSFFSNLYEARKKNYRCLTYSGIALSV